MGFCGTRSYQPSRARREHVRTAVITIVHVRADELLQESFLVAFLAPSRSSPLFSAEHTSPV